MQARGMGASTFNIQVRQCPFFNFEYAPLSDAPSLSYASTQPSHGATSEALLCVRPRDQRELVLEGTR